jgi:D-alanine-D-alanine ligase
MGGDSPERAVSLWSGWGVAKAFDPTRFEALCVELEALEPRAAKVQEEKRATHLPLITLPLWQLPSALREAKVDVVFPALHGGAGENGMVAALMEAAQIPCVGSGMMASALAMDKVLSKKLFAHDGLPTPNSVALSHEEFETPTVWNRIMREIETLGMPVVTKPVSAGSTIGVSIVRRPDDLRTGIEEALRYDSRALVEEFIDGIEVTASILGEGATARALPLIEIVPKSAAGFYDFEAKYARGGSDHLIPPRLPEDAQRETQEMALHAYRALGCRGFARADFMVHRERGPFLLEINTLPGMTETSLVPDAAKAAGMSFAELVEELIRTATK